MNKENLRSDILRLLGQHPNGLSESAIIKTLASSGDKVSHADKVTAATQVSRALVTLKHQHRAFPIKGLWTITSKGSKTHG